MTSHWGDISAAEERETIVCHACTDNDFGLAEPGRLTALITAEDIENATAELSRTG